MPPSYVQDIDDNISADDKKLFWIERKDLRFQGYNYFGNTRTWSSSGLTHTCEWCARGIDCSPWPGSTDIPSKARRVPLGSVRIERRTVRIRRDTCCHGFDSGWR